MVGGAVVDGAVGCDVCLVVVGGGVLGPLGTWHQIARRRGRGRRGRGRRGVGSDVGLTVACRALRRDETRP